MSKLDKSAAFGAAMLAALPATEALADQSKLERLTDPAVTEEMIRTSGFQIPDAGEGSIIGIPLGNGKYQIVGRFSMPPEAVEGHTPVAGSNELLGSNGVCAVYHHSDPEKRLDVGEDYEEGLYEPQRVCSYQVDLTDDQIHRLAYGQARVNNFFASINVNNAIPAVGGREIVDPIQVSTYNLDPTINRELHLNTAKVWLACWDANPNSNDVAGFDHPNKSWEDEVTACTEARAAANSKMGDVRVGISEARLDAAEAARTEAEAARDSAERDNQTLSEILDILRRKG